MSLIAAAIALSAAAGVPAEAQDLPVHAPRVEIGLDGVIAGPDGAFDDASRELLSPRVTINLSPRTALALSGDMFTTRQTYADGWSDSHVITAEVRRALVQSGRFAMHGVFGGGAGWRRSFQPAYTYTLGGQVITVPDRTYVTRGGQVLIGVGFEQRLAPRLALHQEFRAVMGEATSDFRTQVGVSVPLGRFSTRFDPPRTRDGGRPDSLANGTRIGAIAGAAALAGFVGFLSQALCEGECDNLGPALAIGAAYGAGAGALTGAIIDSFRE